MIMLTQHLQRLLLDTDCIAVPGLGCFVVHTMPARYVEEEAILLAPSRALSFHTISLGSDDRLVQAYMLALNVSYVEAEKQLAYDVSQLKREIQRVGTATLEGIGVFSLTYKGDYYFEPCNTGKYRCQFLGLDNIAAPLRCTNQTKRETTITLPQTPVVWHKIFTVAKESLKYAAVFVVALLSYFMVSYPIDVDTNTPQTKAQMMPSIVFDGLGEKTSSQTQPTLPKEVAQDSILTPSAEPKADSTAIPHRSEEFTIVLASAISQSNAQALQKRLLSKGYKGVEITQRKQMTRVILGRYPTKQAAQKAMMTLPSTTDPDVKQAWVMALPV